MANRSESLENLEGISMAISALSAPTAVLLSGQKWSVVGLVPPLCFSPTAFPHVAATTVPPGTTRPRKHL